MTEIESLAKKAFIVAYTSLKENDRKNAIIHVLNAYSLGLGRTLSIEDLFQHAFTFLNSKESFSCSEGFLEDLIIHIILPEQCKKPAPAEKLFSDDFFSYCRKKSFDIDFEECFFYEKIIETIKQMIGKKYAVEIQDNDLSSLTGIAIHNNLSSDSSYPLELVLSLSPWGRNLIINHVNLNHEILLIHGSEGVLNGFSVLWFLLRDESARNNLRLQENILKSSVLFNSLQHDSYTIKNGIYKDQYVICLWMIFLFVNNQKPLDKLNVLTEIHLNSLVSVKPYENYSIFYCILSFCSGWIELLAQDEYRLGKLINEATLNAVIPSGQREGHSVAFWLSSTPKGIELLAQDNYRLARLVNEATLNAVIPSGQFEGHSVAFWLSCTPKGIELLAQDEYRLGKLINEATLNAVIPSGRREGQSVAFYLSLYLKVNELLAQDGYRLGKLIKESTLNAIIPSGQFEGCSVGFLLSFYPVGQELLAQDQYRLLNLINEATLNAIIPSGKHKGESLHYYLSQTPDGRQIIKKILMPKEEYPIYSLSYSPTAFSLVPTDDQSSGNKKQKTNDIPRLRE